VLGVVKEEGKWSIYDPQAGNEKPYYAAALVDGDSYAVAISGYAVDAFIYEADLVEWRSKQ